MGSPDETNGPVIEPQIILEASQGLNRDDLRILVVHDDAAIAYMLSDLLSPQGYTVVVVANGQVATHVAERYLPDLMIVDVDMPGLAAFELCARFKSDEHTRLIPIIMVSKRYGPAERLQSIEAGADEYLCTLHSAADLMARVRQLLWHKCRNDQLEPSDAVVAALGAAVAAVDPATAAHMQRSAEYALMIGQRLGLSAGMLAALRQGALLHDVGKIGVDAAILRKDGLLTEVEHEQMRQHPLIGEQIVWPLRLAVAVAPIVRSHHERWDGCGYPDGLGGDEIPLGARIVAVADTFDALTSPRAYCLACSNTSALNRLQAGAGSQWDARIVDALMDCTALLKFERAVGTSTDSTAQQLKR
jgi:putative two-component system response regulator